MNEAQKTHIETYLPELTHCTFLSCAFLKKLQETGFLNGKDMEILEAERHDNGTVAETHKFFDVMMVKTTPGVYEAIVDVVRETHQAEALKILEKVKAQKSDGEGNDGP